MLVCEVKSGELVLLPLGGCVRDLAILSRTHAYTQEAGYTFVELNASATRSKRTLHEEVASHLGCLSLDAFVEGRGGGVASGKRHALIMDEVDGMAGNEDRGGIQV